MDRVYLHNDTWYVTVICPIHGTVDELVPLLVAGTPLHAAEVADPRHSACFAAQSDASNVAFRQAEIVYAEREVDRADRLLAGAEAALAVAEPLGMDVTELQKRVDYYSAGPTETRIRLAEIRATNAI